MSRRQVLILTDDLDGDEITSGGGETVAFALRGVEYEIDLSNKNREQLTRILLPYIEAGRRVGGRKSVREVANNNASELAAMREWAKANGYQVATRGRISKGIQEAYLAAAR